MKKELSLKQTHELMATLKARFEKNLNRHKGLDWHKIEQRLMAMPEKVWSLNEMEKSGGEPDVIGLDKKTGDYLFCDCSAESPAARRSCCYDRKALDARKENKPKYAALELAQQMGIEMLGETDYRYLQQLGKFDCKTSSWIKTPDTIRNLGGALFCDRRYETVFVYHNGAESYYAARGFRGLLRV